MTLRFALLGAGRIGKVHARAVASNPQARLVAVADAFEKAATDLASAYGAEVRTIEAIEKAKDVDAVIICTPTDTHADLIERFAKAGKAIFCEKPIDLSVKRVEKCLAVVDKTKATLMVGFNRRFDPHFAAVRKAIDDGAIGAVEMVTITSRDPGAPPLDYIARSGGIFRDMTIHDFDMARYVVGSPVVRVMAQGGVMVDPSIGEAGDLDTAVTVLTHESGAITTIDNCRQASYGYDQRVETFGSLGSATSNNHRANYAEFLGAEGGRTAKLPDFFLERYMPSYLREWETFVAYVRDGGPSPVPGEAGRAAIVLGEAAWQSFRSGVPVDVSRG